MNITIPALARSPTNLSLIPPRPQVTHKDMEPTASTSPHLALLHHPSDGMMAESYEAMLKRLIKDIDMKILGGPYLKYCDNIGNRGLTAVTIIETSHIAMHVWDEDNPSLVQLDVYST